MSDYSIALPTIEPEVKKVKCQDCGFLTLTKASTDEYITVNDEFREKAERLGTLHSLNSGPICFKMAFDLLEELRVDHTYMMLEPNRTFSIIARQRECSSFMQYKRGFSPKDHAEKMDKLAEQERVRNDRIEDRKWQANLAFWNRIIVILAVVIGALLASLLKISK